MFLNLVASWWRQLAFAEAAIVFAMSVGGLGWFASLAQAAGPGPDGSAKVSCGSGPACHLHVSSRHTAGGAPARRTTGSSGGATGGGSSDPMSRLARHVLDDAPACSTMGALMAACMAARLAGGLGGAPAAAGGPPAPAVPPIVVARHAAAQLDLPAPEIRTSPARQNLLVGLPTWLWISRSSWGARSASASVPGVAVTARARATQVVWATGDGVTVRCAGPGTPWSAGTAGPAAVSPTCGHTYRRAMAEDSGRLSATVSWSVSWSGAGQSGVLPPLSTTASVPVRVEESQAINHVRR